MSNRLKWLVILLSVSVFRVNAAAPARFSVSGAVVAADSREPVAGAVVTVEGSGLWAVADRNGEFVIGGVQRGRYAISVASLGYVTYVGDIEVANEVMGLKIDLTPDNLEIDEVVVTAREAHGAATTVRTIGSTALEHLQMLNASDVAALLPGGKTVNPDLMTDNVFSLRGGGTDVGNASFGTAVEVDGVRLSTNSSFGDMSGASTRNIASSNVESVEVITGVPSAEYGDMTSGIVKINTRKGRTPWAVQLTTNPRTKQASAAKGFDLGGRRGVLNVSAEYARATKNPVSPYSSYTRGGLSLNYNNTFRDLLRFNVGVTGNIGGMNTKDDPDAYTGEYEREHDNALRANASLVWLLNRTWITDLSFNASVNYQDNLSKYRSYSSSASQQPAVHAEDEGYFVATMLPYTYFATQYVDSKALDYAADVKATWSRRFGRVNSSLKAGLAWRADGNVGRGEYYGDPLLAPNGYRPRPYTDIPYMHNIALYVEEKLTVAIGRTSLQVVAGVRGEKTFIRDAQYDNTATLSPRLNMRWRLGRRVSVRAGWGFADKLPSFNILYPSPSYRDIQTFGVSYGDNRSTYIYYTRPNTIQYNPDLRWQRNRNAEAGLDLELGDTHISLVGYANRTKNPYMMTNAYEPFSYTISQIADGYVMPSNPAFRTDSQGVVYVRDADDPSGKWTAMKTRVVNSTFIRSDVQSNGADIDRYGAELVVDFPEITPIRTRLRLDGAYCHTKYINDNLTWYYLDGWSHTSLPDRSYQYVGIYANNGGSSSVTYNGRSTHSLDMNLTAITRIPSVRMVITVRLEASLVKLSRNLSEYDGREYAFNVSEKSNTPTGGSIYDGNSYTAIYPIYYMDLDGVIHRFTSAEAANPDFSNLILRSNNAYQYNLDGYDPYFSANISITKEIGDHVSLSFYANNFTNSRRYVASYATGVKAIFTPDFYYGMTLRISF